jgi:D-2-hydroxyacid dehydrogenase (NADP+)
MRRKAMALGTDRFTAVVYQEREVPCFAIKERQVERLRKAFPRAGVVWARDEAAFLKALPQAEVALTWEFRQPWFGLAPKLKRIATPAAGRDFFKVEIPKGIEVRHGTFHGPFMAETLLGLMLGFNRGIFEAYRQQLAGNLWPRREVYGARLLAGSHAVIVGFGHIGQIFGRALKSFGVRVTGVKRTPLAKMPDGFEQEDDVVTLEKLDTVLPTADHLILILPNDTGTDNLINAARLALLPKHAAVYNLGRGNCIDEAALAGALRRREIAGACLDVFAQEPLTATSPLAENLPGLVRMPHASAFSETYMDRFMDEVVEWLKK